MHNDSTAARPAAQVPERAPAVERAKANLRGALRVLGEEPFEAADALLVERLISLALADLREAEGQAGGAAGSPQR
jgi:hypothetical protein